MRRERSLITLMTRERPLITDEEGTASDDENRPLMRRERPLIIGTDHDQQTTTSNTGTDPDEERAASAHEHRH